MTNKTTMPELAAWYLPRHIVHRNLHSLRAAIDGTMAINA